MSDEKKIIIDEDWKSQVAAEKAAAGREQHVAEPRPAPDAGEPPTGAHEFPPASFEMLVTIFATEAMGGLGQLPSPMTQQLEVDLDQARYAIDMLEVLAEKTKGNLTPGEEAGMTQLLHQLRMAFVAVQEGGRLSTAGDSLG